MNNNKESVSATKRNSKHGLLKKLASRREVAPLENPEVSLKRPLACSGLTRHPLSLGVSDCHQEKKGKCPGKLRRRSLSTSDIATADKYDSILKKEDDWCMFNSDKYSLKKQAHFCELVSVVVHDKEGNELHQDQIKLKESAPEVIKHTPLNLTNHVCPATKFPFKMDSLEVVDSDDTKGGYVRAIISLGEGFPSDKIELHSARMGLALEVIAFRLEPFGDGTLYYKRYSQRFSLPQPIDPYTIQAALITDGLIRIYADLLDASD